LNQAILQEAVQGKLVPAPSLLERAGGEASASELLKRIKAEKAKSGKKEKPLPPIKPEEIPFEIPENWVWCKVGGNSPNIIRRWIDFLPNEQNRNHTSFWWKWY
jgi:type I restriction enzyme S subunit